MAKQYKCKVPGCDYETDDRYAIAGHVAGHKRRHEMKGVQEKQVFKAIKRDGKYKCPIPGCDYETEKKQGMGGHIAAHIKRGDTDGVFANPTPAPVETEAPEAVETEAPEAVEAAAPAEFRTEAPEAVEAEAPAEFRTPAPLPVRKEEPVVEVTATPAPTGTKSVRAVRRKGVFKCPVPGCDFETTHGRGIGGHIAGHRRRNELDGVKPKTQAEAKAAARQAAGGLKCPVPGCTHKSPTLRGMNVHLAAHRRHGDFGNGSKGVTVAERAETPPAEYPPTPAPITERKSTPYILAPEEIADSLLNRVVHAINASDLKDQQLKVAQNRIAELEHENDKLKDERTRILKIHNEQVHRNVMTTSDELIRLARMPVLRG